MTVRLFWRAQPKIKVAPKVLHCTPMLRNRTAVNGVKASQRKAVKAKSPEQRGKESGRDRTNSGPENLVFYGAF